MNLYLYLPPHSCHAPGTLKGLIFGFAHRAYALCTNEDDRIPFLRKSYYRLLARGHQATNIRPMFQEAIEKILTAPPVLTLQTEKDTKQPLYFHLPFNPANPLQLNCNHFLNLQSCHLLTDNTSQKLKLITPLPEIPTSTGASFATVANLT